MRAYQSLSKLRKPEFFYSWLLGIARRVALEQFRTLKRREQDGEIAEMMMADSPDS